MPKNSVPTACKTETQPLIIDARSTYICSSCKLVNPLSNAFCANSGCSNASPVTDNMAYVAPSATALLAATSNPLTEEQQRQMFDHIFKYRLGHRLRSMNCGGATPIPHVQAWLKRVFTQCQISENYASTETGAITNTYSARIDGNEDVGKISVGVTVKLLNCGEYKTTDKPHPRGELLVKTLEGAVGYLNRPDLTAEAWDCDGYFHTGDICEMPDPTHVRFSHFLLCFSIL